MLIQTQQNTWRTWTWVAPELTWFVGVVVATEPAAAEEDEVCLAWAI